MNEEVRVNALAWKQWYGRKRRRVEEALPRHTEASSSSLPRWKKVMPHELKAEREFLNEYSQEIHAIGRLRLPVWLKYSVNDRVDSLLTPSTSRSCIQLFAISQVAAIAKESKEKTQQNEEEHEQEDLHARF
ncbi:hypothetical protein Efla_007242 [Eimeria flavescens]